MKIIGHRGAMGLAPENTVASIKQALKHNVDEIEFDLRVTSDNRVVLDHSRALVADDGKRYSIAKNTYEDLLKHKKSLATFEEVLDVIGDKTHIYAEIKPGVPVAPIVAIIDRYLANGWKQEQLSVGSYSQKVLLEFHKALPNIETIVIENWSGVRAGYHARQLGTKRVSMNQKWLWSGFIHSVTRNNGWQLSAFTLNDPKKAARWEKYGLYGAITNYPDRYEK